MCDVCVCEIFLFSFFIDYSGYNQAGAQQA